MARTDYCAEGPSRSGTSSVIRYNRPPFHWHHWKSGVSSILIQIQYVTSLEKWSQVFSEFNTFAGKVVVPSISPNLIIRCITSFITLFSCTLHCKSYRGLNYHILRIQIYSICDFLFIFNIIYIPLVCYQYKSHHDAIWSFIETYENAVQYFRTPRLPLVTVYFFWIRPGQNIAIVFTLRPVFL